MGALARLSRLKAFLGIPTTDTTKDEELKKILLSASAFASSYCRRQMEKMQRVEEHRTSEGQKRIVLEAFPVISVARVVAGGEAVSEADYWFTEEGILTFAEEPPSPVQVTYTAGYETSGWVDENQPFDVPAELEQAVVLLATSDYRDSEAGSEARWGIERKTWASFQVEYAHPDEIPPKIREILDRYRRWDSGL